MLRNKKRIRFGAGYLFFFFFCVASTFCSSHTDPNSLACIAIKFLNIQEEDLFGKLLSLGHKIHQQKILCCLILLLPHRKKNLFNQRGVFVFMTASFIFVLIVSLERCISRGCIKNCCVKFVYFQACSWEANRRKIVCRAILYILLLFVRSFNCSYTRRNKKYFD